jgi:hypothetical protein
MKLRYWLWTGICAFTIFNVIACGKSTEKNTDTTVATVPLANATCASGQTLVSPYGYPMCQGANGYTTPIYNNGLSGAYNYGTDNYCYRNISIVNSSVFQAFLKEAMGVCNQATYTGGLADCSYWTSGYFKIDIMATSTQMQMNIYSYPYSNGYSWYTYSMPSMTDFFLGMMGMPIYTQQQTSATLNPLPLSFGQIYPINNSQGFEVRSYGNLYTLANRSLIQLQVQTGHLGDAQIPFQLTYSPVGAQSAQVFAKGTLINKSAGQYYGCY